MGSGEDDAALCPRRGEVLRRPRQPPRQLRLLRLEVPRVELRQCRPQEGHRRPLGEDRPRPRPAFRRLQPRLTRLALVPARLRPRPRGAARRRALRCRHAHQGRRQGQVVGGPRPAGALLRPAPPRAGEYHRHQVGLRLAQQGRWQLVRESPAARQRLRQQLVPPRSGPRRQIPARPLLLRRRRHPVREDRPGVRHPFLQRQRRAQRRQGAGRHEYQTSHAGPARRGRRRHRARRRQGHHAPAVADRHLHRLLALQAESLRGAQVQDRRPGCAHARRYCEQERQPPPQRPGARQRRARRGRDRLPRRHGQVDGREQRRHLRYAPLGDLR